MSRLKKLNQITEDQQKILKGLFQIDSEIGAFYQDALMILTKECILTCKVNLIAHLSREIDGGFRDVFAPKGLEELEDIKKSSKKGDHYASIVVAMGFENDNLASEWFSVAGVFHKFAHRHGINPRDLKEFENLWKRYEKVLLILVGSSYAFTDRVNQLMQLAIPPERLLKSLPFILQDPQHRFHFFKSLDKPGWLNPLIEAGMFTTEGLILTKAPQGGLQYPDWLPLRYLHNIAAMADGPQQKVIIGLIRNLQSEFLKDKISFDDFTVYLMYQTATLLSEYLFNEEDIRFLKEFDSKWPVDHKMYESVMTEELIPKYLAISSKTAMLSLIPYCLGYRVQTQEFQINNQEPWGPVSTKLYTPNISDIYGRMLQDHTTEIIALAGLDLLKELVDLLNGLDSGESYELTSLPSVEPSDQRNMDLGNWRYNIVDFLAKGGETLSNKELGVFLDILLSQKATIFQRIAYHLIRKRIGDSRDLFWKHIHEIPLNGQLNVHELYLLLKEYSVGLNDNQFVELLTWIEKLEFNSEYLTEEESKEHRIHQISRYFTAMNPGSENQRIALEKAMASYGGREAFKSNHPEYQSFHIHTHGYDVPESALDLSEKSVSEQIAFLVQYEEKDAFDTKGRGLNLLLNNYVIEDTDKYLASLSEVLLLPPFYLSQVISSFAQALKNGSIVDWKQLLDHFQERTTSAEFAKEGSPSERLRVFSAQAEFVLTLANKNDSFHFSENDLNNILEFAIEMYDQEDFSDLDHIDRDYIGYLINSPRGKLFEALIHCNRLWLAFSEGKGAEKLHPAIKDFLNKHLTRKSEREKDFSLGLGYHFAFILFADPAWCDQELAKIFPDDSDLHKTYTLSGLLSNNHQVSGSVIKYLKSHRLNEYAIMRYSGESGEKRWISRFALIEMIHMRPQCIDETDSLLFMFLENSDPTQLIKLIQVCIELQFVPQEVLVNLWRNIAQRGLQSPDVMGPVLKDMVRLTALNPTMTADVAQLIRHSIPFLNNDAATYTAIRSLIKISASDPLVTATLILEIWKQTGVRVHVNEELRQFVESLYIQGNIEIADGLCLYTGETGELGLKSLYDNYKLAKLGN